MSSFYPNTNPYASLEGGNYLWKGPDCKDRLALVMMIKNEEQNITNNIINNITNNIWSVSLNYQPLAYESYK